MRTYKIIAVVFFVLLLFPLLTHYYLTQVGMETDGKQGETTEEVSPWITHQLTGIEHLKGPELKFRIEELLRIKQSVSVELRGLESRRTQLQTELAALSRKLDDFKSETGRRRNELDRIQISLQQAHVAEKEAMERNTPRLGRPRALHPLKTIPTVRDLGPGQGQLLCSMDSCFDYSLCPLSAQFSFHLYPLNSTSLDLKILHQVLSQSVYKTRENRVLRACVSIVLIDNCSLDALRTLGTLPNWFGDGRNHILWLNCKAEDPETVLNPLHRRLFGRALVLDQNAERSFFRYNFDLVLGHWSRAIPSGEIWPHLPPIVPAKRKYLATYLGGETEPWIQSELLKIQQEDPASFVFQFSCASYRTRKKDVTQNEVISTELERNAKNLESYTNKKLSSLCSNDLLRTRLLLDSTFSLILLSSTGTEEVLSTPDLQLRLFESLKFGAVPVILGTRFQLPYDEVIDWSKLVVRIPTARVTEIHYFLKSFTDSDILGLRKNGRLVFENYMGSVDRLVETVLGVFRTRIGLPPLPYEEIHWKSAFNESFTPLKLDTFTVDPDEEESLGPMEPSYPSPAFTRNYTTTSLQKYDLWNTYFSPFRLYKFTPWELVMPSEAKFQGSSIGFRPIGTGAGGSGKEFSEALGGNAAKEQFTIVLLTYERETVLMNSLQRLFALPYLNKVVVVWNSPQPPSPDLKWPDIGVPVRVVKAEKNSLNNRFLPFEDIETEAVLSIDDDAHLRHDEIVFGFRVWRENRDRVVGFPGRFHALDLNHGGWLYNSNYSCELSMVLTGAAFYHKLYSYMYTYEMPEAIRNKVDELMNCEDIAMNFLVSHVTNKPPVKVTSRWTFRCPGCPVTLSEDDSHFQERHHCINFFTKVYGYTPLLNTQFRADSVLFKTRIPHDKQKCFKYI